MPRTKRNCRWQYSEITTGTKTILPTLSISRFSNICCVTNMQKPAGITARWSKTTIQRRWNCICTLLTCHSIRENRRWRFMDTCTWLDMGADGKRGFVEYWRHLSHQTINTQDSEIESIRKRILWLYCNGTEQSNRGKVWCKQKRVVPLFFCLLYHYDRMMKFRG